jgi:hypothetical protein
LTANDQVRSLVECGGEGAAARMKPRAFPSSDTYLRTLSSARTPTA